MASLTTQQKAKINELYQLIPQEEKVKNEVPGIYGIYCDDKLVYVGKSTKMLNRWLIHKTHTLYSYSTEYNRPMYTELRRAYNLGHNISIKALEYCTQQELKEKEHKWIAATLPPLNTLVPRNDGSGRERRKGISPIC